MVMVLLLPSLTQAACSKLRPHSSQAINSPCEHWTETLSKLSQSQKETLAREKALRVQGLGWILDESLVSDCITRVDMAEYFQRVVSGESEKRPEDRGFAAKHSRQIVEVLGRLWPSVSNSKALVGDGAFGSEIYNLLAEPGLRETDIAPLVEQILTKEGVHHDLAYVLFAHRMPTLRDSFARQLSTAEKERDLSQQIYLIALLHNMGKSDLSRLNHLLSNKSVPKKQRDLINALKAKIQHGKMLTFSDVEDLGYIR
jgi:hypothetical protein